MSRVGAREGMFVTRLALVPFALLLAGGGSLSTATFNPDPVFPVGPISVTASHQIVELDRVATALADWRAIVNCWSESGWKRLQEWQGQHHHAALIDASGVTFFATHRIQLSPEVCQVLAQVIAKSAQQPLHTAWAVTVLAHESAHASGIRAENLAECRAITTEPRTARALGIPTTLAARLQHIYRGTVYPAESPAYRTPPCAAGLPGALVPDALGVPKDLRPLESAAKQAAPSLPQWRNIGGAYSIGPLSPCAPVTSRAVEVSRFGYALLGPGGEYLAYSSATLRTQKAFSVALARERALPRCDLQQRRSEIRNYHSTNTVSLSPLPASIIAHLSPQVRTFRVVFTANGKSRNLDSFDVFDRAKRTLTTLFFSAPVGRLPASVELRAAAAVLTASLRGG